MTAPICPPNVRAMRAVVVVSLLIGSMLAAPGARGAGAQPAWDRQAIYAAREAQLKAAIDSRPADPQPLVDLAAFYLKPVTPRDVEAADDPDLARPLLKRALQMGPKHPRAARESAMLLRMKSDLDGVRPYMEAALRHDPLDLDMCRLHLDHRTAGARVLNDQAVDLRTPRVWEEQRADGRYRVTRNPSAADLARANELDQLAQQARREAVKPLRNLAGRAREVGRLGERRRRLVPGGSQAQNDRAEAVSSGEDWSRGGS